MFTIIDIINALEIANQVKKQWRESIDKLTPELFESVLNGIKSEYLCAYDGYYVVYGPEEGTTYGEIYLKEKGFNVRGPFTDDGKSGISFTVPKNHIINEVITNHKIEQQMKYYDMIMQTRLTPTNFKKLEYGQSVDGFYKRNNDYNEYVLSFDWYDNAAGRLYCINKLKYMGFKVPTQIYNEDIYFSI